MPRNSSPENPHPLIEHGRESIAMLNAARKNHRLERVDKNDDDQCQGGETCNPFHLEGSFGGRFVMNSRCAHAIAVCDRRCARSLHIGWLLIVWHSACAGTRS